MFQYYNANPYNKDIADCVIRSISVLTDRDWADVYDELSYLARNEGLLFSNVEFVEDYLDQRYPRQCHYSKSIREFAKEYPRGKYAITTDGHITALNNGILIDTFDPSNRVMRCAWKIDV